MLSKTFKVVVYDPDIYGLHAINSYLAWDRRTRVVFLTHHVEEIFEWLAKTHEAEWPDMVVIDTIELATSGDLTALIHRLRSNIPDVQVMVMEHFARLPYVRAAEQAGAMGYFLRNDVGIRIAWGLVWAESQSFAISPGVQDVLEDKTGHTLKNAPVLPDQRSYPELTDRIRQAIQLCVVEGMSADLAADEMGVSPHTIRSYIKEGYRIMESYDDSEYPPEMSPQERAFMRFTALEESLDELEQLELNDDDH
jgi:DNA-binding NarL/FixJ family response regulator